MGQETDGSSTCADSDLCIDNPGMMLLQDLCVHWSCRDWITVMPSLQDSQWQHWRHCSESCTLPPDLSSTELTPAWSRDARSSGTALVTSLALFSSGCVYWFTRYSSAVCQGTSATCWPSLLMYPEDPQSGHQAAVTSLCHVQVASSGTEPSLLLLPEPGTDYQWNWDTYVPHHCSSADWKLFYLLLSSITELSTEMTMKAPSVGCRCGRRIRNTVSILYLYWTDRRRHSVNMPSPARCAKQVAHLWSLTAAAATTTTTTFGLVLSGYLSEDYTTSGWSAKRHQRTSGDC